MKKMLLFLIMTFMSANFAYAKVAPTNKLLTIGMAQEMDTLNPMIMTMSAAMYIKNTVLRPMNTIDENWKWVCVLFARLKILF